MRTHEEVDARSLALSREVARRIDADPARSGLARARGTLERWLRERPSPALEEWRGILARDWEEVRLALLDPGEEGRRRRQSSPFCGVLTPRERWAVYREHAHGPKPA